MFSPCDITFVLLIVMKQCGLVIGIHKTQLWPRKSHAILQPQRKNAGHRKHCLPASCLAASLRVTTVTGSATAGDSCMQLWKASQQLKCSKMKTSNGWSCRSFSAMGKCAESVERGSPTLAFVPQHLLFTVFQKVKIWPPFLLALLCPMSRSPFHFVIESCFGATLVTWIRGIQIFGFRSPSTSKLHKLSGPQKIHSALFLFWQTVFADETHSTQFLNIVGNDRD